MKGLKIAVIGAGSTYTPELINGFIGQETTGIGGFMKAMRTIPVMLYLTEKMKKYCPDAWLINFTNPSGLLAEVLLNNTDIKTIGLCNAPLGMNCS